MLREVAGDRKLGDWVREVLSRAALIEPTATGHRTIPGEVLTLRKILLGPASPGHTVSVDKDLRGQPW